MEITIDHRLGVHFPSDRRERLWSIQQNIEQHRLRSLLRTLVHWGTAGAWNRAASHVLEEFASVLDDLELKAFFDLDDVGIQTLQSKGRNGQQ